MLAALIGFVIAVLLQAGLFWVIAFLFQINSHLDMTEVIYFMIFLTVITIFINLGKNITSDETILVMIRFFKALITGFFIYLFLHFRVGIDSNKTRLQVSGTYAAVILVLGFIAGAIRGG